MGRWDSNWSRMLRTTEWRPLPKPYPIPKSKRILHKPLAKIGNQKVFLPLWAISSSSQGLSLEFQIIQDATAPMNAGASTSWQLSNVRIYGGVLHCDESLQNTYARHLLNGKNLTIPMRSYTSLSFSQPSGGSNATLMIPRTLSRVNAIFLVGWKGSQKTATSKQVNHFCYPGGDAAAQLLDHTSAFVQRVHPAPKPHAQYGRGPYCMANCWISVRTSQVRRYVFELGSRPSPA